MAKSRLIRTICVFVILSAGAEVTLGAEQLASESQPTREPPLISNATSIWEAGVGEGFRPGIQTVGLSTGAGLGVAVFGGSQQHDLALMSLTYGRFIGGIKGVDHWYRGNWEWRAEIFGGAEFSPSKEWVIGFTPHLRYNFATSTRWVPFVDGGAGVSGTGIGHPDLSNTFEFNLQASTGVQWFVKDNFAVTFEARWLHLSDAGITSPNLGVNTIMGMVGLSWFF